jgi:23S rRNA (adenine2503-C2)-methyltransferase
MDIQKLEQILNERGEKSFRKKQILERYISPTVISWDDISHIPQDLREVLREQLPFSTSAYEDHFETSDVIKFVFKILDGDHRVEAVVMKHTDGRRTLCLSCQSGCPMACTFCATGTMGLKKNLTASEMFDIVKKIQEVLHGRNEAITNIVYMGMGEPFATYHEVKESLYLIHDYIGLGWRKISVSTCGIVPKIREFARDFPQVNLAISLHAASDEKRSLMMPINNTFNLASLMQVCKEYVETTHRKLFFEYLVIDNFNDGIEDAQDLKKILDHPLYHLNLIRFHATDAVQETYGVAWKAPTKERLRLFIKKIDALGIPMTLRRSFGERIDAACGMLALKHSKK